MKRTDDEDCWFGGGEICVCLASLGPVLAAGLAAVFDASAASGVDGFFVVAEFF